MLFDPEHQPLDILEGLTDPDSVEIEVAPDEEADVETGAAIRVLRLVEKALAAGKPETLIPCPFCQRPLRYKKDKAGILAECPGGDFVAMG